MNRILSRLIFSFTLLAALTACVDEVPYDDVVPEGMGRVSATVDFKDFMPALESRAAGDAIKSINSLWVVVYNTNGEFIKKEQITDFKVNTTRPNTRPDGANQAEASTGHAEFKFTLPNGRYHIYAVANFDLSKYSDTELATESDLQNIELEWDNDLANVAKNAEMFGYFTESNKNSAEGFDAPVVTVKGGTSHHAWIRRAASKLTIVYDGSGLKDNVVVYIKSATIKDIPMKCYLGATNRPGGSTAAPGEPDPEGEIEEGLLFPAGETVKYYEGDTEPDENSLSIANYKYAVSAGGEPVGNHDENSDKSLFFYENVQPKGEEGTVTDKRQVVKNAIKTTAPTYPNGNKPGNGYKEGWKDGRKYGTYVEIEAFYRSDVDGHRSSGKIIYRFMLGKDVTTSYAAERNYHYKLTMKFKGYANDVDFHIDYEVEEPSLQVHPYYISYLYNHSMLYPMTIRSGSHKVQKVQAEIVENAWVPSGATPGEVYYTNNDIEKPEKYPWHGFLSLRKTKDTVLKGNAAADDNKNYYYNHLRHRREYSDMSEGAHYLDNRASDANTSEIPSNYSAKNDDEDGNRYYVKIDDSDEHSRVYEVRIPMWTRAKQMIKSSGYTGNNPYVAYQRKAKVKIDVWFEGNDSDTPDLTEVVPITQVRRVVNPKGIYRSAGSDEDFHVTMRVLEDENDVNFIDLVSEGPWKAYIIAGNKSIANLSGGTYMDGDTVKGKTGSKLDFDVDFTGNEGCAVIRVDYHNYTCNHLIFLRNGYEPIKLTSTSPYWHTLNLRTKNEETNNPADEGSLFKFGNLDYPLDASTNVNNPAHNPWTLPDDWTWFRDPSTEDLKIATDDYTVAKETVKWDDFAALKSTESFLDDSSNRKLGGKIKGRVATFEDYKDLYENDDIEYGYGVLYGDGATKCAKSISAAYGYRHDHKKEGTEDCGMRGTFVYNKDYQDNTNEYAANSIFFPIGNSGYGYRRVKWKSQSGDATNNPDNKFFDWGGLLKYSARNDFYKHSPIKDRPLFYDLWRRPGGIYWLNKKTDKKEAIGDENNIFMGWDFNYFTFDFFPYTRDDLYQGKWNNDETAIIQDLESTSSGAAFVRLVQDTAN